MSVCAFHLEDTHLQPVIAFVLENWDESAPLILVAASIYIDRIHTRRTTPMTSKELGQKLAIAVLLASKWLDDLPFGNKEYAEIFAMEIKKVNRLEAHLFMLLGYNLTIDYSEFEHAWNMFWIPLNAYLEIFARSTSEWIDPNTAKEYTQLDPYSIWEQFLE